MSLINALVSEIFADFEDFGNSANKQSLEEELRSDPHEE